MQAFIAFALLAVFSGFSYAQDAGADGQAKPAAAADDHKPLALEPLRVTVTVTSQKAPEPALDLPLSVTAVALFYMDWSNLQLNQQLPFGGGLYYIGNAGRANSKGVEFEARYRPLALWEVFGSVGYTDARFLGGSTVFNANLGANQAVEGNTLPYTPACSTSLGTQVSWSPCRRATLYVRVEMTRHGDFEYDASNAMGQPGYGLTNFRAGVRVGHWFAEGWVDNAFDAHYVPIAIPYAQLGAPSGYVGESGAPLTYGGRAGIKF